MINVPRNAGEKSTYLFTVPPLQNEVSTLQRLDIHFPNKAYSVYKPLSFDAAIGENIKCGIYIQKNYDPNFFTYHSILEMVKKTSGTKGHFTYSGTYMELPCSVSQTRVVSITGLEAIKKYDANDYWFSYLIQNVNNPSSYDSNDEFELIYLSDSGVIQWSFKDKLKYFVSAGPNLIKMTKIDVSDTYIRNPATYDFSFEQTTNFNYLPSLGISITLPSLYSDVI